MVKTMKIENKNIEILHHSELNDVTFCHISNSIITTIDFIAFDPNFEIIIENCIISNLLIHSCWFKEGLIFKNNHVINYIDYQMGGHNKKNIKFIENIFNGFFNFFDCQFDANLELYNNIFIKGSNLLGNNNEGFKNFFENEVIFQNNIGEIYLDGIGI